MRTLWSVLGPASGSRGDGPLARVKPEIDALDLVSEPLRGSPLRQRPKHRSRSFAALGDDDDADLRVERLQLCHRLRRRGERVAPVEDDHVDASLDEPEELARPPRRLDDEVLPGEQEVENA